MARILTVAIFLLSSISTFAGAAEPSGPPEVKYEKARIIAAEKIAAPGLADTNLQAVHQQVTLKISSGKLAGQVLAIDHIASGGMAGANMVLAPGDKVLVYVEEDPSPAESPDGSPLVHIDDYQRDTTLFWLAALYCLVLAGVGGKKGLRALFSLVLTVLIIFYVLFPLTLRGWDPLLVAIAISGAISLLVFRIIGGRTAKALSAALGTLIGVASAGLLATAAGKIMHLSGLSSEEAKILLYSINLKVDFQGLLFSGILLGALGAVMDVGMSIASAIDEVRKTHPKADFANLFNAGMNVGRDVMGTMSNTLILAYAGSALPLLLLFLAGNIPFVKAINMELVAEEIARALAGSIGLVLCIPATALVAAALYTRQAGKPNSR